MAQPKHGQGGKPKSSQSKQSAVLKCQSTDRNTGLCIIPGSDSRFYSIVQIIREQYDRGYPGTMPHIHLIFPFLPKNIFDPTAQIISDCLRDIGPFEITTCDLVRTAGTGKQYCYLLLDEESNQKVVELQSRAMTALCSALRAGNGPQTQSNMKSSATKKGGKRGKTKKCKNHQKGGNAVSADSHQTCLEMDVRNTTQFRPHLTVGNATEREFKVLKKQLFGALREIESEKESTANGTDDHEQKENSKGAVTDQSLLQNILRFEVSALYFIYKSNQKRHYRIGKTIALECNSDD